MRVRDSRPPFAGLANLSEAQLHRLPTPCYLLDEAQLRRNGEILLGVQQRTGCRILLAQKAFSNFNVYPVLAPYLAGTEPAACTRAAWAGKNCRRRRTMCSAPPTGQMSLRNCCNTPTTSCSTRPASLQSSARRQRRRAKASVCASTECSTQEGHEIYDPCAPGSRPGHHPCSVGRAVAAHPELPALLDGLHFHTLCEQDADALAVTLAAVEKKFADLLPRMKWLNFGGGHHITRLGYALATLENCILSVRQKYGVQVYLEPARLGR